jgi:hypothetical protein
VEIQEHIVQYYNKLYFEQCSWRPRVDGLSFLSIDADESIWLEREFEENEMWDVVRDLNGDKAPRPDGFTMAFFQKCWEIVKNDLMAIFAKFHNRGQFVICKESKCYFCFSDFEEDLCYGCERFSPH